MTDTYHGESGYLDLLTDILDEGNDYPDRTGVGCRKVFDRKLVFDLSQGFPLATVRHTPLRIAMEEFWFFLRGHTNTKILESKRVHIWKGNTSRDFLDSRGLQHLPEGDMGKTYGYQLRYFGGYDQLKESLNSLKKDPYGRRHVISMWNPADFDQAALPPCWWAHQFYVSKEDSVDHLNLKVFSRSADCLFGLPFNYQQYALYLSIVAKWLDMAPKTLSCDITDAHLYSNQIEYAEETVLRDVYGPCSLIIHKDINTFEDIIGLQWEDIELNHSQINMRPYVAQKPEMAV